MRLADETGRVARLEVTDWGDAGCAAADRGSSVDTHRMRATNQRSRDGIPAPTADTPSGAPLCHPPSPFGLRRGKPASPTGGRNGIRKTVEAYGPTTRAGPTTAARR